ncbi:hypothetical protein [Herbaspirillum seropedicae]|uniref:hypothetical protein n=1 Tax=Herbaspirillum seropedicae TaxID=964 RepID=UPI000863B102|nr:hypothetical protein [Herbaspirillum seropedicae]AON55449.1 hypothetical protein Hsc_3180 [Herbaspirillum seropedicae]
MNRYLERLLHACVGIVVVLAVVFLVVGLFAPAQSATAAAWAQAFGSVAAIVGGWIGIQAQIDSVQRNKESARREQSIDLAKTCLRVVKDVRVALLNVRKKFVDQSRAGHFVFVGTERIESLIKATDALIQKDLPPILFEKLVPVRRELAYTLTALREHNSAQLAPALAAPQNAVSKMKSRARKAKDYVFEFEQLICELSGETMPHTADR